MNREAIQTAQAPAALGPYAQAVKVGNLLFTSGQIAIDPATNQMVAGDIVAQTKQGFANLQAVLAAAGATMQQVVKTTVFVQDLKDFATLNEVYATYFTAPYPARSCVEVAALPKGALLEVELVAVLTEEE